MNTHVREWNYIDSYIRDIFFLFTIDVIAVDLTGGQQLELLINMFCNIAVIWTIPIIQ